MSLPAHRPLTARRQRLIHAFRQLLDEFDYAGIGFPKGDRERRIAELCVRQGFLFARPQGQGRPCGYSTTTVVNHALAGQLVLY
jgi:hypothetical protein